MHIVLHPADPPPIKLISQKCSSLKGDHNAFSPRFYINDTLPITSEITVTTLKIRMKSQTIKIAVGTSGFNGKSDSNFLDVFHIKTSIRVIY